MTSTSISPHDLLHPFPAHTTIHQLVTPTDHHGRHYCHDWVSHHHHQQAGSDDGLKHEMDIQNGIGAWVWEEQKDDTDDFDSDDIQESWVPSVVKKMNPKRASTASSVPVVGNTDDSPPENDSSSNNSVSNNNGIRVCSDCNTTKTPLWRSGPRGPKSLCNACGIRQRKARRALAAASAAIENNAVTKATTSPKSLKVNNSKEMKKSSTKQGGRQGYKKMLKISATNPSSEEKDADDECGGGRKEICFEEFITINLSKNTALHPVFPQDEKEAAILLMALSCGLVHN